MSDLAEQITRLWDGRDDLAAVMPPAEARAVVHEAIELLDRGDARVAEVVDGEVVVHEWLKQAILLLFRLEGLSVIEAGPFEYHDKLPLKHDYASARVRVVPGGSARWGSYLAPGVILMPSYVNIGARVGADTMVDTSASVRSTACRLTGLWLRRPVRPSRLRSSSSSRLCGCRPRVVRIPSVASPSSAKR